MKEQTITWDHVSVSAAANQCPSISACHFYLSACVYYYYGADQRLKLAAVLRPGENYFYYHYVYVYVLSALCAFPRNGFSCAFCVGDVLFCLLLHFRIHYIGLCHALISRFHRLSPETNSIPDVRPFHAFLCICRPCLCLDSQNTVHAQSRTNAKELNVALISINMSVYAVHISR